MAHDSIKSIIERGSNWKNKKTGKVIIVLSRPKTRYSKVNLLHSSGRKTTKEQHYFLYEYERI